MTTHRELAERFAQTLTDHDLDAFAELLDDQYVNHNRFAAPGKHGSVGIFASFLAAFDGFRVELDDVLEAGDSLVGRYTYRGRHTGEFLGIPPSGAGAGADCRARSGRRDRPQTASRGPGFPR